MPERQEAKVFQEKDSSKTATFEKLHKTKGMCIGRLKRIEFRKVDESNFLKVLYVIGMKFMP